MMAWVVSMKAAICSPRCWIFATDTQGRDAEQNAENDHCDDRGGAGVGEIFEYVRWYESDQHVGQAESGDGFVARGQRTGALELPCAFSQPFGGESESAGNQNPDQRRDHGGAHQDADHTAADAAQRGDFAHPHHGGNHHHQHQWHDDHAQQVHVGGADRHRSIPGWRISRPDCPNRRAAARNP